MEGGQNAANGLLPPDPEKSDQTLAFGEDFPARLVDPVDLGLTPEESAAISALPSASAMLVVRRGPNNGARFLLDSDEATAGRHPNADIFLDDVTVSRKHARFLRAGKVFRVVDLGSLNGTYLDGVRVNEAVLDDGAEVQIGKYILTFYASLRDQQGES